MKSRSFKVMYLIGVILLFVLACGGQAGVGTAGGAEEVSSTEEVEQTQPATEEVIQHNLVPGNLPEKQSGEAADFDASNFLINSSIIGGDRFTFGKFERPFNANVMDTYFSQLDIIQTRVFQDEIWVYTVLEVKELTATSSANEKYAIEIDTNIDGKGDWLVIAYKPTSTEWVVTGVQMFQDANQSVGADVPAITDEGNIDGGDGFETMVFDQGNGNDPDTAWIRISPNNPNTIEFAIKLDVMGSPKKLLIGMWAGTALINPSLFDINDHFSHDQAGAADLGLPNFYPIKEVAEIDNSCRIAIGFQPTGKEPGLCAQFIPVIPGDPSIPPPAGCKIQVCTAEYTWNPLTCSCEFSGPR